jgi:hypothetical protein
MRRSKVARRQQQWCAVSPPAVNFPADGIDDVPKSLIGLSNVLRNAVRRLCRPVPPQFNVPERSQRREQRISVDGFA